MFAEKQCATLIPGCGLFRLPPRCSPEEDHEDATHAPGLDDIAPTLLAIGAPCVDRVAVPVAALNSLPGGRHDSGSDARAVEGGVVSPGASLGLPGAKGLTRQSAATHTALALTSAVPMR